MAAFCGHCGTALRGDGRFCPVCGSATGDDDDTADREMPAWFANGEPPPGGAGAPASVTVARAPVAPAAVAAPAGAQPATVQSNLYLWVSGAVVATAAVVITVVLLFWPQDPAPPQDAATPPSTSTTTTTTTTAATPVTTLVSPTTTVPPDVFPTTLPRQDWQSWININTDPNSIQMYPCRQMAAHGVPYDFVVQYFHRWNYVYLAEGGGGMDQDGNGKPCEGQFPESASYRP